MPVTTESEFPPCFERIGDERCTGCSACANICPHQAIAMRLTAEGFYRPVLRPNRCTHCRACERRCPVLILAQTPVENDAPQGVWGAWSTDNGVHQASSSGGVFSELARQTLARGGIVCGCAWGTDWTPRHVMARSWDDVAPLRGSKYLPSRVGETFYRRVIEQAQRGTEVLFCGTPCQVAALRGLAPPRARERLLLVDLICHGVPSLVSFWRYIEWKFGSRRNLVDFTFRNKELSVQTICARTTHGERYLASCGSDPWFRAAMVEHLFLQSSCMDCPFGGNPRQGDLTLGDFWGIPDSWHDQRGDSLVMTNTARGAKVFAQLVCDGQLSIMPSRWEVASRSIGRTRGEIYRVPYLRRWAMRLLARGWSYEWVDRITGRPMYWRRRLIVRSREIRNRLAFVRRAVRTPS